MNDPAMLREVAVVGGNSLSGLLETPALRVPTITIGARQAGRTRGAHVVDAEASANALGQRLGKVLDPAFREGLEGRKNPHGGRGAERVVNVLKNASRDRNLIVKRFHDGGAR